VRRSVYCTASFSVCSRRRTKMPIIYADFRLDYKLATLPIAKPVTLRTFAAIGVISGLSAPDFAGGRSSPD
jgi:hypothetical protein